MRITRIASAALDPTICYGGHCPAIYETEQGDLIIQGFVLLPDQRGELELPAGEDAVRIPRQLLEQLRGIL